MATRLEVEVIDAPAKKTIRDVERQADRVGSHVTQIVKQSNRELRNAAYSARFIIMGIRSLTSSFGKALDPFQSAMVGTVETAVTLFGEIAAAEITSVVGAPMAVYAGMAILALQMIALPQIYSNMEEAKANLDAVERRIMGLESLFGGF